MKKEIIKKIGKNNLKFILQNNLQNMTKKDAMRLFREIKNSKKFAAENGSKSIQARFNYLLELNKQIVEKRDKRATRKHVANYNLAEKLARYKEKKMKKLCNAYAEKIMQLYRYDKLYIFSSYDPGIEQTDYLDWDYYAKSCKYPKKITTTILRVDPDLLKNDQLQVIDSIANISISNAGDNLYFAKTIKQSRGYELKMEDMYIAYSDDLQLFYHHKDAEKAKAGLARKIKNFHKKLSQKNLSNFLTKNNIKNIVKFFDKNKLKQKITQADVKKTGACAAGIKAFVNRHKLNNLNSISVLSAMLLYQRDQQDHLLQAIYNKLQ